MNRDNINHAVCRATAEQKEELFKMLEAIEGFERGESLMDEIETYAKEQYSLQQSGATDKIFSFVKMIYTVEK